MKTETRFSEPKTGARFISLVHPFTSEPPYLEMEEGSSISRPIVSVRGGGVRVGCTWISMDAFNYIKELVEKNG